MVSKRPTLVVCIVNDGIVRVAQVPTQSRCRRRCLALSVVKLRTVPYDEVGPPMIHAQVFRQYRSYSSGSYDNADSESCSRGHYHTSWYKSVMRPRVGYQRERSSSSTRDTAGRRYIEGNPRGPSVRLVCL